jgi:hypothetical protein
MPPRTRLRTGGPSREPHPHRTGGHLVGINPALDAFIETAELMTAELMKKTAHQAAIHAGRALANR